MNEKERSRRGENETVSVIIPVYRVEKYIDECINSVIQSTYKDIEIILIDDESPDKSLEICKKWVNIDSRIKLIQKENGGVSSARNLGMEICTGKYIIFVDADDKISPYFIEKLYKMLNENDKMDIAMCSFTRFTDSDLNMDVEVTEKKTKIFNANTIDILELDDANEFNVVWNKMYRNNLLSDKRFLENISYGEDLLFILDVLEMASNIIYSNEKLYYYRTNENSVSYNMSWEQNIQSMDVMEKAFHLMCQKKVNEKIFFDRYFGTFGRAFKNYPNKKKEIKRKYVHFFIKEKKYTLKQIKCWLFLISMKVYEKLVLVKRK